MVSSKGALTDIAARDLLPDVLSHARPPIHMVYIEYSPVLYKVIILDQNC